MATTSAPPPPPASNLKFVAIGLIFLLAAGGLWALMGKEEAPPAAAAVPSAPEPARVNPMAEQQLELEQPAPEPDAAVAVAPTEPKKRTGGGGPRNDSWDCSGDIKGALQVINSQRPQVRACYERRLKVNNILQGELKLKLKVGAGGKVTTTAISGSLHDAEVNACVQKLAAAWEFEAPSGGNCAVVQVPFQFSPKQ